jgi:hypothetical protein
VANTLVVAMELIVPSNTRVPEPTVNPSAAAGFAPPGAMPKTNPLVDENIPIPPT